MKIIFTGGGTGGHIYPIVAIVQALQQIKTGERPKIFYIGPRDPFCDAVLAKEGVKIRHIQAGKIRRYFNPLAVIQNGVDMFIKIPIGVIQSFFYIFLTNPDLIFSKGGYGSYPVTMSGWLLGVPIFLQESDISPGEACRRVSKRALEIFVSFPKTEFFPPKKQILVGNPIRLGVTGGSQTEAQKFFGLSGVKPVVLFLGGSQGAQRINDKILDILSELLKKFEIIHQTGQKNLEGVKKEATAILDQSVVGDYHPYGFLDDKTMPLAYAAADLIVSRSGSGSIFEIAANKKPSILIPLPEAANNHQVKNAYCYSQAGAAVIMEENNFTANFFLAKIKDVIADEAHLKNMSLQAERFSRPRAAHIIADYIINYLTR